MNARLPSLNLLDMDRMSMANYFESIGEKPFRVNQLFRWLHGKGVSDIHSMSDISATLRQHLTLNAFIPQVALTKQTQSEDGVIKWLFHIDAQNAVETVFIPQSDRATLCISSQAGCCINCSFCATGAQGFARNLTTAEIIGQLRFAEFTLRKQKESQERIITNVVMMGMGEPLLNYHAVLPALKLMLDDHAYGLSRRRVTVSTSGVVPFIDRLGAEIGVALAVSLHAANDALRDQLVPLNRKYPLKELMAACDRYLRYAPRPCITFEYCLIAGVNDSASHSREVVQLLKNFPAKVNLIPFNHFDGSTFKVPSLSTIQAFSQQLKQHGLITTLRKTYGEPIAAACGQLAGDVQNRIKRHGIPILVST